MKERKTLISVLEFLRTLALAVLLVSLFMSFVLRPMQVAGDSMAPVLHDGERVFINVLGGMISDPQRFDVVVVRQASRWQSLSSTKGIWKRSGRRCSAMSFLRTWRSARWALTNIFWRATTGLFPWTAVICKSARSSVRIS